MSQFPPLAPWLPKIHFHPPTKETVWKRARLKRYPGHFAGIQGKIEETKIEAKPKTKTEAKIEDKPKPKTKMEAKPKTNIEANMSAGTASPIKTQKQIFIVGTKKHRMKVQQENEALNEALSKVVGTLMCCGSIRKKILKKQVKV